MKRINKITSLILLAGIYILSSCESDRGALSPTVSIDKVPAISTKVNATGSQSIDVVNLANFKGKIDITSYFESQELPEKVDVVVRKNASNASTKVFKAGITALPASLDITASDLTALFGVAPKLGDNYDFSVNIYTKDGNMFEAFPLTGLGTASGPSNMINYSYFARFGAICAYDSQVYQGEFVVVADGWGDYAAGDVIELTRISNTQFSFKYADTGALPIVVTVAANNTLSVAKQVQAPNGYGTTYGPFSVVTVGGGTDNFVSPCDETVTINLEHSVAAGYWPAEKIILKKKR